MSDRHATAEARRRAPFRALLLAVLASAGCGAGAYTSAPLDAEEAQEALETTMETWKRGEKLEALGKSDPPIVVLDIDWGRGVKLLNFELNGEDREEDGTLVSQVKLTLQDAYGSQREQAVAYRITTSPSLVVSRDIRMGN